MKKIFLLFISVCISGLLNATIFYVSSTGNDASGTGTISNPWKTLVKAANTVTTPGDIIHLVAGTYIETSTVNLRVGVSLEGEGVSNTIVQSTLTSPNSPLLQLSSPIGTNGNQTISNIKFDGRYVSESNYKTQWGIDIEGRSNVKLLNCIVTGFYDRGVIFNCTNGFSNSQPTAGQYAVGNVIAFCQITNSSTMYPGYGTGCLNLHGQKDMLIHDNLIQQNERASASGGNVNGDNGWPIKYYGGQGWLKNLKFYNNTVRKKPWQGTSFNEDGWNFCWENYQFFGCEIYNNLFDGGALDVVYCAKGEYTYGIWIHDNTFSLPATVANYIPGIQFEFDTENAIVEKILLSTIR